MAKKKFKANLFSIRSLEELQKELQKYNNSLEYKCREIAERLAEQGVEIARVQVADLDAIFTGELIESIHSEYKTSSKNSATFIVVADSDHALFVEFGTGIVGKQSPYPYNLPAGISWEYASGKTIRQLSDGRYGWFYKGDNGQIYFTEGMQARPFMHNTYVELQSKVIKVVKEVFK